MTPWHNVQFPIQSPTVEKAVRKLNTKRTIARVNLPALARRDEGFMSCWVADEGYRFVSCDFTSLEPTITAEYSKDPYYRYATYEGIGREPWIDEQGTLMIDDIYLMTASRMPEIGEPVLEYFRNPKNCKQWVIDSEVCKNDPIIKGPRKKAKPACLGFNYGMGPKRFVNQSYDAGMTVSQGMAKDMYQSYWALFAGVKGLVQALEKMTKRDGFLVNPFGYRLTTEPHKGYNAFIQSTASGVLDVFNLKFFDRVPDVKFVAIIHDEVIFQCPINQLDKVKVIKDECVKELNDTLKFTIPMRLGWEEGNNFAELK